MAIGRGLGLECSGVVSEIGPATKGLRVGDRVMAVLSGAFQTRFDISEKMCAEIPDQMPYEDAATLPVVYCTVLYAFTDAVRLQKGMVSTLCTCITDALLSPLPRRQLVLQCRIPFC